MIIKEESEMNILDSFKKINLNSSGPAVSISSYGLTFNKTVVETMSLTNYVVLLLDETSKRIAIQASENSEDIPFCVNKSNRVNARINNKEFARKLFKLMDWELSDGSYRVVGTWYPDDKVYIFDLKEAELNITQNKDESGN